MSMTNDSAHQALDINIGRVLEMFQRSVLTTDQAEAELLKFFSSAERLDGAHLNVDLTHILERVQDGTLDPEKARSELVKAAAASEKNDPRAVEMLHQISQ